MTSSREISRSSAFLALVGFSVLAGGGAGLLDGLTALPAGGAGAGSILLHAVSLGALLVLAGLLPVALVLAGTGRPRSGGACLGLQAGLLLLAPAGLALGRALYKRIPWDAGDALLALGGLLGGGAFCAGVAVMAGRIPPGVQTSLLRFLSRAALPSLLLLLPAAGRILPALGGPGSPTEGRAAGPNLLLLTVDTLREDRLGCTGDPAARTPCIDRLARGGTLFADCVAPSPWTLPSLGTVLTGTYPGEHRVLEALSGLSGSVSTIAQVCRESGRRTAAFVSNPWLATGALGRGFDTFDVAESLESLGSVRATRLYRYLTKVLLRLGKLDSAPRISAQGISWIERGDGAWFLWLHYFDPHLPNWPPPPYDRLFGPPPTHVGSSLTVEEIREGAGSRPEIERLYEGEVTYTDRSIGLVWRYLESAGALASTAIVFAADHGEEFWDHDRYGHGHAMFEEVVRVPLVLRPAGGAAGRVFPGITPLVDLAPSAVALAGIEVGRATFRGRDLLSSRNGGEDTRVGTTSAPRDGPLRREARVTYGEATLYGPEQKFLRAGRWKLIYRPPPRETPAGEDLDVLPPRLRLYDLRRDPGERFDLAGQDPARTDSLFAILSGWMEAVGSEGAMAAREIPESIDPSVREQLKALGYLE